MNSARRATSISTSANPSSGTRRSVWRCGVDHGYNIMSNETDVTRRMYAFIADHVVRATSRDDTQEAT